MTFVLTAIAILISYEIHAETMDKHYKKLAKNVAQTAAELVDNNTVDKYTDIVKNIYLKNTSPNFKDDKEKEAYFAQYSEVLDKDYNELFDKLYKIKISNNVLALYIIYVDAESKTCVYVINADNSETGCPVGTWDKLYEQNYDALKTPENGFDGYITNSKEYGWLCSAGAAIKDDDGNVIAYAMVDLSMEKVMNERYSFLRTICVMMLIVSVFFLIIFIVVVNKSIVTPINNLSVATRKFVENMNSEDNNRQESLFDNLTIKSGDEIENLFHSIQFMEKEIQDYIVNLSKVTAEKERIGTELSIANQIQANMLPSIFPAFPERDEFDIYATMNPAKEVGGDFYDFFMLDDRHLAIVIADVSGKGVPAALFMVIGKTLIKDHTQSGCDLGEVFTKVNNLLCESNSEGLFITAFEGILDLATGDFVFVNAGHEIPYIYRKGKLYEPYKTNPGFVLAGMENMNYTVGSFKLEVGDKLFQYTDGVTEATSVREELYGRERLQSALNKNTDKSPTEILAIVKEDIDKFVGEAPQFDDITMLCLEYKKKM